MKALAAMLTLGLALLVLQACGFLQGAAAGVSGSSSAPPAEIAAGSWSELLWVLGYAVAREGVPWVTRKVISSKSKP
jgi:hypothetical protein